MTSNLAIAPSLASVQTLLLAPVLTSPTRLRLGKAVITGWVQINGAIGWIFDAAWRAEIGDPPQAEAIEWLRAMAIKLYPDGPLAEKYGRGFE
jgi:hypothetical protein